MESNKHQLLDLIRMYDFYLYELQLYLDSHSTCPKGLSAFKKYKELRERAVNVYVNNFGPLTAMQSKCGSVFEWVKGPWPWEKEAN